MGIAVAVSGRAIKTGSRIYKAKGRSSPFYYGIQPMGRYPDEPFIQQRYFDTATGDRIRNMKPPPVNTYVPKPDHYITCPNC